MAGVDLDLSRSPWTITYNAAGGTPLPAKIWPQDIAGEIAPNVAQRVAPFQPRRIVWTAKSAIQDDGVVLKDLPPTGAARVIFEAYATGADFENQQFNPAGKELFMGLQITQMDAGVLRIFV